MKKLKGAIIAVAVVGSLFFSGCNNTATKKVETVDKAKLAELTVGKNFDDIDAAYTKSIYNNETKNIKIYEYWLKKNGAKVDPTFDFELYKIKIQQDKKNLEKEVDEKIANLKNLSDMKLVFESRGVVWSPYTIYKKKYAKAINAEAKRRVEARKAKRKKLADAEKMRKDKIEKYWNSPVKNLKEFKTLVHKHLNSNEFDKVIDENDPKKVYKAMHNRYRELGNEYIELGERNNLGTKEYNKLHSINNKSIIINRLITKLKKSFNCY